MPIVAKGALRDESRLAWFGITARAWLGLTAVLLACAATACTRSSEARVVEVGKPAPDYSTVTLSGDTISLAALRGKAILLNVWATWCAPCKEEIPYLEKLHAKFSGRGLEIVGVSVDARGEEKKIEGFARDMSMTYPVWLDPDQRVMSSFLAIGVPASYLIDRNGVLRWRHLGVLRASNERFNSALEEALR